MSHRLEHAITLADWRHGCARGDIHLLSDVASGLATEARLPVVHPPPVDKCGCATQVASSPKWTSAQTLNAGWARTTLLWAEQRRRKQPLSTSLLKAVDGVYAAADPLEMDAIAAEAWDPVLNPASDDPICRTQSLP